MADPVTDTLYDWDENQRREQEAADRAAGNALARQAGSLMAAGDRQGAMNALYRGGDFQGANTIASGAEAERKRQAEAVDRFTTGVSRMIDEGIDPQTAWEAGSRLAPQLGIDPAHLANLKPEYDRDPRGFATFYGQQAKDYLKIYQSGRHVAGIDTRNGKQLWTYDLPQDPARAQGVPQGFRMTESGDLEIDPGFLAGKAALAKATRAPARGRSGGGRGGGGGGSSGLPPGYVPR